MIITTNHQKRWEKTFKWHKWFAWYPIILDNEIVWLRTIYRRRVAILFQTFIEYSLIKPQ